LACKLDVRIPARRIHLDHLVPGDAIAIEWGVLVTRPGVIILRRTVDGMGLPVANRQRAALVAGGGHNNRPGSLVVKVAGILPGLGDGIDNRCDGAFSAAHKFVGICEGAG